MERIFVEDTLAEQTEKKKLIRADVIQGFVQVFGALFALVIMIAGTEGGRMIFRLKT